VMSEYNSKTTKEGLIKIIEDKESLIQLALHHDECRKLNVEALNEMIEALEFKIEAEQGVTRELIQSHIDKLPFSIIENESLKDQIGFLESDLENQKSWNRSNEIDELKKTIEELKNKIVRLVG
jgi:hypothetical protein